MDGGIDMKRKRLTVSVLCAAMLHICVRGSPFGGVLYRAGTAEAPIFQPLGYELPE